MEKNGLAQTIYVIELSTVRTGSLPTLSFHVQIMLLVMDSELKNMIRKNATASEHLVKVSAGMQTCTIVEQALQSSYR